MGALDTWTLTASGFVGWSHILFVSWFLYNIQDLAITPQCKGWVGKRLT